MGIQHLVIPTYPQRLGKASEDGSQNGDQEVARGGKILGGCGDVKAQNIGTRSKHRLRRYN